MLDDNTLEERLSEDGTLHLSEWERLSVDISNFDPLQQVISPEDGDKCKELSVYYYYGARIKASCYVGATAFDPPVPVKKGKIDTQLRQVIITPKICDREEGWADFLRMLEVAYNIKVPDLRKEKSELDRVKDLRPILALVYARAVEDLLKKRLRRNYVVRVDRLNSRVKGKLLLAPYIREQVARGQPQIAVCQYYELTPDTPLNRIVKAGLWAAKRLVAAADNPGWDRLSGELNKSLGLMGFVQDVRITRADCARVRLHAQNRYYETAFMLAQLLLFACRFEYESGSYAVAGFFLDMNDLFEGFIMGLLHRGGYDVEYQHTLNFRVDGRSKLMKPDYIIRGPRGDIIGDAKYKEIFEDDKRPAEETVEQADYGGVKVRIYPRDVYQLVAYMDNTGANQGVLFYPAMKQVSTKTVFGFGGVPELGGKTIKIKAMDLYNIKALIEQEDLLDDVQGGTV